MANRHFIPRCPYCGEVVDNDASECGHCKTKLEWETVRVPVFADDLGKAGYNICAEQRCR